jgi:hypothetical protein
MATTTPDNIYYNTGTGPQSIATTTAGIASSVQSAFSKRQRYSFVWPTASERSAQGGMVEGSIGYQVDTKTEYQYENSAWRLKTPHIEFTATSPNVGSGDGTLAGNFAVDTTRTNSPAMASAGGIGIITLTNPGLYSISTLSALGIAATGRSFLDLATTADDSGLLYRAPIPTGEDKGSIPMPNYNATVSNSPLFFKVFQTTGTIRAITTRVRITRIG